MTQRNSNRVVRERERLDFAKIKTTVQIPNLIDVQKKSYQRFLQMDLLPSEREDGGLQSVFTSVFPIQDFRGLSHRQLGVQVRPFARPAPLARHLPQLRRLGGDEPV
jgi:DNA-directed RNA polymerase beta subunit